MPTQMPRKGRPRSRADLVQRLDQSGNALEPRAAVGEGADSREHQTIRAPHDLRIVGDANRLVELGLARGSLEGLHR